MTSVPSMNAIRHLQRVYYSILFLRWFAGALPIPFVILIMQKRGLNLAQIGLISGLYSLTIVLLELPTGGLADALGRKPVALAAHSFLLLANVVFLLAFSFYAYLAAYVLLGIGRALSSGALDAWFVDKLLEHDPNYNLQPPLAYVETFGTLGLALGALTGGIIPQLFSYLPNEASTMFTPFAMTFIVSIAVRVVAMLVIVVGVRETRDDARDTLNTAFTPRKLSFILADAINLSRKSQLVLLLLAGSLVASLALMSVETFWQPHFAALAERSPNSLLFGTLMTLGFLMGTVGNLASIRLSRLFKQRHGFVAALSQGLAAISILVLASQTRFLPAASLFCGYYFSLAMGNAPVAAIFNREIPSNRRSSMQSILSLAGYSGSFLGSFVLGLIAHTYSVSTAWLITGIILLISSLLYVRAERLTQDSLSASTVSAEPTR
ncbi:MAG: MFS transporter [Deinococcota bacterium]